jgi:hypothetical protein
MKQSAVEWLVSQIWKNEPLEHEQKVIEQAFLIEKKQLGKTCDCVVDFSNPNHHKIISAPTQTPILDNLKKHLDSITSEEFNREIDDIIKNDESTMLVCDDCGMEECDCGLTDDELIIKDKHSNILKFAEWFKSSDWDCFDSTDGSNVYANTLITDNLLTIEEIYELYLKETE